MRSNPSSLKTITSTQSNLTPQTNVALTNTNSNSLANDCVMLSAIAFAVVLVCTIMGYRKYRTTLLQRQIQRLNRLWQLDCSEKLF